MSRHNTARRSPLDFAADHAELVLLVLLLAYVLGSVMTR